MGGVRGTGDWARRRRRRLTYPLIRSSAYLSVGNGAFESREQSNLKTDGERAGRSPMRTEAAYAKLEEDGARTVRSNHENRMDATSPSSQHPSAEPPTSHGQPRPWVVLAHVEHNCHKPPDLTSSEVARAHPTSIKGHPEPHAPKGHDRILMTTVQTCANSPPVPTMFPTNPTMSPINSDFARTKSCSRYLATRKQQNPSPLAERDITSPNGRSPTPRPRTLRSPPRPRHLRSQGRGCR